MNNKLTCLIFLAVVLTSGCNPRDIVLPRDMHEALLHCTFKLDTADYNLCAETLMKYRWLKKGDKYCAEHGLKGHSCLPIQDVESLSLKLSREKISSFDSKQWMEQQTIK